MSETLSLLVSVLAGAVVFAAFVALLDGFMLFLGKELIVMNEMWVDLYDQSVFHSFQKCEMLL